jgi:hypothetical protein
MKKIGIVLVLFMTFTSYSQTAKEFFERGIIKRNNKNYKGAIYPKLILAMRM